MLKCNYQKLQTYLEYAYFYISANKEKVDSPINWLFTILYKTGTYQKPTNYRSPAEIEAEKQVQLEAKQAALKKAKAKKNERLEQVKQETEKAESFDRKHGVTFQKMLNNPSSKMFIECLDLVGSKLIRKLILQRLKEEKPLNTVKFYIRDAYLKVLQQQLLKRKENR